MRWAAFSPAGVQCGGRTVLCYFVVDGCGVVRSSEAPVQRTGDPPCCRHHSQSRRARRSAYTAAMAYHGPSYGLSRECAMKVGYMCSYVRYCELIAGAAQHDFWILKVIQVDEKNQWMCHHHVWYGHIFVFVEFGIY